MNTKGGAKWMRRQTRDQPKALPRPGTATAKQAVHRSALYVVAATVEDKEKAIAHLACHTRRDTQARTHARPRRLAFGTRRRDDTTLELTAGHPDSSRSDILLFAIIFFKGINRSS